MEQIPEDILDTVEIVADVDEEAESGCSVPSSKIFGEEDEEEEKDEEEQGFSISFWEVLTSKELDDECCPFISFAEYGQSLMTSNFGCEDPDDEIIGMLFSLSRSAFRFRLRF